MVGEWVAVGADGMVVFVGVEKEAAVLKGDTFRAGLYWHPLAGRWRWEVRRLFGEDEHPVYRGRGEVLMGGREAVSRGVAREECEAYIVEKGWA